MDARILYTKKKIREEFIKLLKEHPIEELTVKQLCEQADINRATFYKYYENLYDLRSKLEDEKLTELENRLKACDMLDPVSIFRIQFQDQLDNYDFYHTIYSLQDSSVYPRRIGQWNYECCKKTIRHINPEIDEQILPRLARFLEAGCMGILYTWIHTGMKEEIDDVVGSVCQIMEAIPLAAFSKGNIEH